MALRGQIHKAGPTKADRQIKRSLELNVPSAYVANPEKNAAYIRDILKIEGDAMGTLNTQEMFNKTMDGGIYIT